MANPFKALGDRIIGAVNRNIENKLRQAAVVAESVARANASVRTGTMRAGIHAEVKGRTLTLHADAFYSAYQNYGTRRGVPAQHFMEKGINAAGRVLGANFELSFPNTPTYHRPVLYHKGGYVIPGTLSPRQRRHIATNLLPGSRRLHRGNARRAKLIVGPR